MLALKNDHGMTRSRYSIYEASTYIFFAIYGIVNVLPGRKRPLRTLIILQYSIRICDVRMRILMTAKMFMCRIMITCVQLRVVRITRDSSDDVDVEQLPRPYPQLTVNRAASAAVGLGH